MEIIKTTKPQVTPELSEQNIKELNRFLNFFKSKKEDTLKEIDLEFRDFSEDNLQDESAIYNNDDVKKMFQKYADSVKKIVDNDLQKNTRMSGIYIKNFMLETQDKDILLEANLNLLEDIRLIDQMKQIEIGEGYKPIKDSSELKGTNMFAKKIAQKLPNLLGNAMSGEGDSQQQKIQQLEKEIEELKKGGAGSQGGSSDLQSEVDNLKQKIQDMELEYNGVKGDLDKKLNESIQVNNLKKMIQQKNTQVKELQAKLKQYEK